MEIGAALIGRIIAPQQFPPEFIRCTDEKAFAKGGIDLQQRYKIAVRDAAQSRHQPVPVIGFKCLIHRALEHRCGHDRAQPCPVKPGLRHDARQALHPPLEGVLCQQRRVQFRQQLRFGDGQPGQFRRYRRGGHHAGHNAAQTVHNAGRRLAVQLGNRRGNGRRQGLFEPLFRQNDGRRICGPDTNTDATHIAADHAVNNLRSNPAAKGRNPGKRRDSHSPVAKGNVPGMHHRAITYLRQNRRHLPLPQGLLWRQRRQRAKADFRLGGKGRLRPGDPGKNGGARADINRFAGRHGRFETASHSLQQNPTNRIACAHISVDLPCGIIGHQMGKCRPRLAKCLHPCA